MGPEFMLKFPFPLLEQHPPKHNLALGNVNGGGIIRVYAIPPGCPLP